LKESSTPGIIRPSIKTAAIRTGIGTSQNLVNVFTPGTIKNAYKSPYYQIIVSQNKKNPMTISRPFPNHQKRKEKETNPLAKGTAASEQNDLSSEFISFTLMNLLSGLNLDETVKKVFLEKVEQSAMLKTLNRVPDITDTMFRTLNKFYDVHHATMSSKLNEIDLLIEPLKNALKQNTVNLTPCHFHAPDNAYFWKWLSDGGNAGLTKMSIGTTDLIKKMGRIKELGSKIEMSKDLPNNSTLLAQYFQKIDEIDEIFKSTDDSFREAALKLYDTEYLTFMKTVKCVATTTTTTTTTVITDIPAFNKTYAAPLQQVQQITSKLNDFISILQDCAETIQEYIMTLINYFSQTRDILESFLEKIKNVGFPQKNGDEYSVPNKTLIASCENEIQACSTMIEGLNEMMKKSLFLNNVLFLRYSASDPLLNENLFIKYSETPGLIDVDFKTLYKYVFEAHIFVLNISETITVTMDNASENVHTFVKNLFTKIKDLYITASNDYESLFKQVDREAYESSLKLGSTSLLLQGATPDPQLVEAYQTKMARAKQLQTIITVHPQLSYIHCLKMISMSSFKRDKAAWELSKIAVSESIDNAPTGRSIHNKKMLRPPQPEEKEKYQQVMQEFNITNLRKNCAAIMNQTPGNSCTELQLNVVKPFVDCLKGYTKGEAEMHNFYTPLTNTTLTNTSDDALLKLLCDVLNAHLESFGSVSTHAFFDNQNTSFNVEHIKGVNGVNAGEMLQNVLIGLKINLIIITKDAGQDTYTAARYVSSKEDDSSASASDAGSDTESDVNLSKIVFTDYIVLFRDNTNFSVYVPEKGGVNKTAIMSQEDVDKKCAFLLTNTPFTEFDFSACFNSSVIKGGSGNATNIGSNVVPTSSVAGSRQKPTSSLSSQLAAMKNIQKMAKNESKLSYYVMIDLVLVPGDKISIMQMANMECKIKADNIQKSLSETFGFAYAPPPLFTDYEAVRHDEHGAPHKNPYSVDERDVSKMMAQHEKELNSVLSDSYKKEQDLAMERAMRQIGKNYPSKRGFFS
jgi:hypothetical protein